MDEISDILYGYIRLTEFLGQALGDDYEVVFHDLTDPNHSIAAIANGHISGRKVGAPLTNMALSVIREKSYEKEDYRVNDCGVADSGKKLRSNTLFIKHEGKLIGMLCINFDDSRYKNLSNQIMALAHSKSFIERTQQLQASNSKKKKSNSNFTEKYHSSSEAVAVDAVQRELERLGVSADRLTAKERMQIITALDKQGVFLLKGVVKDVAVALHCSQASIYRYMSQLKIKDVV